MTTQVGVHDAERSLTLRLGERVKRACARIRESVRRLARLEDVAVPSIHHFARRSKRPRPLIGYPALIAAAPRGLLIGSTSRKRSSSRQGSARPSSKRSAERSPGCARSRTALERTRRTTGSSAPCLCRRVHRRRGRSPTRKKCTQPRRRLPSESPADGVAVIRMSLPSSGSRVG